MAQALIVTCPDIAEDKSFSDFKEYDLNLYDVSLKTMDNAIKTLFDGGDIRDGIFVEIQTLVHDQEIPKIILVGHTACPTRPEKEKDERELEIELRHVVSAIHAKFPVHEVEAYLKNHEHKFIKVI